MEAITEAIASILDTLAPDPTNQVYSNDLDMDDDDASLFISEQEDDEQSWLEEKRGSLQTYLDSVPYECESFQQMQDKLEFIVGRLYIAAKAKNWQLLTSWDGLLQWYANTRILYRNLSTVATLVGCSCATLCSNLHAQN